MAHAAQLVAKAVYRVLALKEHPDHGGDENKMKLLNLAYEVVEASYPPAKGGR